MSSITWTSLIVVLRASNSAAFVTSMVNASFSASASRLKAMDAEPLAE
jgi:hypothetical protein